MSNLSEQQFLSQDVQETNKDIGKAGDNVWLMKGDCLERMKVIESGSVDLILTDPPYGTVKGMGAGEERYSRLATSEWDVAIKPAEFLAECDRVLRVNGCLALFSQEPYTSRLITEAHPNLPFSYRLIWLKDHFANSLLVNKAPVSYFEDVVMFFKKYDTLSLHPLRTYAKKVLDHCGGDMKVINRSLGHRRAEHFFYVESTQFGLCTERTYSELVSYYKFDSVEWFLSWPMLLEVDRSFSRSFNLAKGCKFKSNVLQYKKDYTGHHPTQKPVALLEDLITTYSEVLDTVLDFTMGSGSTGVACQNTQRAFVGIERDEKYFDIAAKRILGAQQGNT